MQSLIGNLNDEVDVDVLRVEFLDKVVSGLHGSTGGEEIVVEYPPAELCAYPEYRGKPYYSIKYEENGEHFVGFGTYNPEVLTRYLKEYFMVKPQKPYKAENEEAEE